MIGLLSIRPVGLEVSICLDMFLINTFGDDRSKKCLQIKIVSTFQNTDVSTVKKVSIV